MKAEIFGPYRILGEIGRGGMGEVHEAFDTVRERTVALKRLVTDGQDDEGVRERFRRESRLDSPHVLPIHDFGVVVGWLFIDMRLVLGEDLARLVVPIPDRGMNKINAAYSFGGPTLLVQTIESLTQVRADHFAIIDFAGFSEMADAAGGIDVTVPVATSNAGVDFRAGPQHLDGRASLAYVRQRYGLPGGDFDRVRRQQNALRSLANSAISSGTLSNPVRAYELADTLTRWVGVDDTLSNGDLRSLVFGLRGLRSSGIDFLTAPVTGTGMQGAASVVYLDQLQARDLWFAVNNGTVTDYLAVRPSARLPAAPR